MPYEVSVFDPRTMGKLISRMPPVRTFFRDTFFRHTETFPTKSVDVDFKKGNRALAPFVHPRICLLYTSGTRRPAFFQLRKNFEHFRECRKFFKGVRQRNRAKGAGA